MRLILWSFHSNGASANDRDRPRFCSSGSKSVTVVPSSTLPTRVVAPAQCSSASASVVLPDPPCPTSATLRIFSGAKRFTDPPVSVSFGENPEPTHVPRIPVPRRFFVGLGAIVAPQPTENGNAAAGYLAGSERALVILMRSRAT